MRLRPLSIAAAFVLLLLLAYTAYWVSAAWQVRRLVEGWVEQQRAAGAAVAYSDFAVSGWPLELDAGADVVRIAWPDGRTLEAPHLRAVAAPWNPLDIRAQAPAGLVLALPPEGDRAPVRIAAATARGTADLNTDGTARTAALTLEQAQVQAGLPGGPILADALTLGWAAPPQPPVGHLDSAGTLSLNMAGTTLSDPIPAPLGQRVDRVALTAELRGPFPDTLDAASLRAWSGAGGTVELTEMALAWAGLDIRGDGTLALDRQLQPQLAGTAYVSGTDVLVQSLVAEGKLTANQGAGVRAALGLMARPQPDGRRAVQVPITVQERQLSLGPVRVMEIPPVVWP